jgi:peptide/nickel transport system ATP-binding protein
MLEISNLEVGFRPKFAGRHAQVTPAVRGVSVAVEPGEIVGLVGESGSGKSVTCHAALGLLGPTAQVGGSVSINGKQMLGAAPKAWRGVRGKQASIVLQDPFGSLNPLLTVGRQIVEAVRACRKVGRHEARSIALGLLDDVGLPDAPALMKRYPHELSGGMCQRVVIATALAGEPDFLFADEATTALDVTVQAQVVDLIAGLAKGRKMGVLFVTHDLGVAASLCDRIVVMQSGLVVEEGSVFDVFTSPRQEYTRTLLNSLPANQSRSSFVGDTLNISDGTEGVLR